MYSVGIAINRDRESTCHLFGGREFDVFSCEDRDQFNIRDLGHSDLGTAVRCSLENEFRSPMNWILP